MIGPEETAIRPGRVVPPGACDCHAHICGPAARYDYAADRIYTPPDALLPAYLRVLDGLGIERAVLVQPSIYGTDNQVLLDAIAAAPIPCRGVVVLDPTCTSDKIADLHQRGVRGVRFNVIDVLERRAGLPLAELQRCAEIIAPFGWHIELQLHVDEFPNLDTLLSDFPVDLVLGHFGYPRTVLSPNIEGYRALFRLMEAGRCWVKLSAPYRLPLGAPKEEVRTLAAALVAAAPERLLWASDWPHTNLSFPAPDDSTLFETLFDWVPDANVQRQVLVDNPAQLYDF